MGAFRDSDFGWCAPFIMANVNTRVVRRTNAVLDYPYGEDFRYSEAISKGEGFGALTRALGEAVNTNWTYASCAIPPVRALTGLWRPGPGGGPTREQREDGSFDIALLGKLQSEQGEPIGIHGRVGANRCPGYGSTAWMLAESALCLALDSDRLPVKGGSWTPASAMGSRLIERLKGAGMTFRVNDSRSP